MKLEIPKDKNSRCKICGKTIAELEEEGYSFHEPVMANIGTEYQNTVCHACLDVIDDRIVELIGESDGFLIEALKDRLPQLLFELAISAEAERYSWNRDKALKSLLEKTER